MFDDDPSSCGPLDSPPQITKRATMTPCPPSIPFFPGPIHELHPSRWYDDDDGVCLPSTQDPSEPGPDSSCETSFASGEDTSFTSFGHSRGASGGGDTGDSSFGYTEEYESANTSFGGSSASGVAGRGTKMHSSSSSSSAKELVGLGIFGLDEEFLGRLSSLRFPHSRYYGCASSGTIEEGVEDDDDEQTRGGDNDGDDEKNLEPTVTPLSPYPLTSPFGGHILTSIPECDFEFDEVENSEGYPDSDSGLTGSEYDLSWLCSPSPSPSLSPTSFFPTFAAAEHSECPRDPLCGLQLRESGWGTRAVKGYNRSEKVGVRLRASTYPSSTRSLVEEGVESNSSALVSLSSLRGM
ncbi:hypothetical protein MD484_g4889, partial [Candolleomyces efflorescens]